MDQEDFILDYCHRDQNYWAMDLTQLHWNKRLECFKVLEQDSENTAG